MTRTEPCACGGSITADAADPVAVTNALRMHQRSPQHVAWWLGMRLEVTRGRHHKSARTIRMQPREGAA